MKRQTPQQWFLTSLFGRAIILAFLIGQLLANQVRAQRQDFLLPQLPQADSAWSSGWTPITPGQLLSFAHNLGGDPGDYAVELWFLDTEGGQGIHRRNYGSLEASGSWYGAHWQNLTASTIEIYRQPNDLLAGQVRLLLWIPSDPPDFDSDWVDISQGTTITVTHGLGPVETDLSVSLWFRGAARGVHHYAYGGLTVDDPLQFLGAYWHNLTENTVQVTRLADDTDIEQVRVTVTQSDPPNYDSLVTPGGWQNLTPGAGFTFNHNLNWNPNLLLVRGECFDPTPGGLGIHQQYAGGDEHLSTFQGAHLQNLTANTVTFVRRSGDTACSQARLRIWQRAQQVFLPVVMNYYAQATELAYDDGVAESNQSHDQNSGFAVLFTPPVSPMQLVRARFYLIGAAGAFPIEVHVWDTAHNNLIVPFQVTPPAGEGWFDVDLSSYNLAVNGDFYVGFLYPQTSYDPSLGVDTTAPHDGRSYEVPWQSVANDYMIRVVVR